MTDPNGFTDGTTPEPVPEPAWVEHALWWHVYPLGFVGAEPEALPPDAAPVPRLRHLVAWLDYVVELGLSGLALGPVFASHTHGYDTIDHLRVDPRLGTEDDLLALVEAAHARGLRVTLDGVFNHVGRGFEPFARVLRDGPAAETASWFHLRWPEDAVPGTEPDYDDFEGHHTLVALNHEEPAVAAYVAEVMAYWNARGIDGWRLDAAYAVPPRFWRGVLPPGAYVFGEVLHGDYVATVRESGFHAVTQYELWKAIWSSITDANFFELSWTLGRHEDLLRTFAPLTFVGNHDVTRIASKVPAHHLPHAVALLLTLGGTPTIYAGDEQGLTGVKEDRAGGDDAVRPQFPPTPTELTPGGWDLYRLHQHLIGVRRRHAWLHRAVTEVVTCTNTELVLRMTPRAGGPESVVLALNLSEAQVRLPAAGGTTVEAGPGALDHDLTLPPHGWAVLS